MTQEREYRFGQIEYRAEDMDGKTVELVRGTLMEYGSMAVATIGGDRFQERMLAGAFGPDVGTRKDISANVMHDAPRLVGRTGTPGLKLTDTHDRLTFELRLPDTQDGRDARTLLEEGILNGASVEFFSIDDSYDRETKTRTIKEAKLLGFALVDVPAYDKSRITSRRILELAEEANKAARDTKRSRAAQARLDLEVSIRESADHYGPG